MVVIPQGQRVRTGRLRGHLREAMGQPKACGPQGGAGGGLGRSRPARVQVSGLRRAWVRARGV